MLLKGLAFLKFGFMHLWFSTYRNGVLLNGGYSLRAGQRTHRDFK